MRIIGVDFATKHSNLCLLEPEVQAKFDRIPSAKLPAHLSQLAGSEGVILIDAPQAPALSGKSRAVENELRGLGINSYSTASGKAAFAWMQHGFESWAALREACHPNIELVEVYPHATAVVALGCIPRQTFKWQARLVAARRLGVHVTLDHSGDDIDAALAACTGLALRDGQAEPIGDPEEGQIVLPSEPSQDRYQTATDQDLQEWMLELAHAEPG